MMKREMHSDMEAALIRKVSLEHELFYYRMLTRPPEEIYSNCKKIRFYDSLWEYFQYCNNLKPEHVRACMKEENILKALYRLYLKYEYIHIGTWGDIESLLSIEADRQNREKNAETEVGHE